MALLHVILIVYIALSAYIAFGAWRQDAAARSFERRQRRLYPWMWPKDLKTYTLLYRIVAAASLAASCVIYVIFLVRYY